MRHVAREGQVAREARQAVEPRIVGPTLVGKKALAAQDGVLAAEPFLHAGAAQRLSLIHISWLTTGVRKRPARHARASAPSPPKAVSYTHLNTAHTAMIVWTSIGLSDLSKPPGRRSTATIVTHAPPAGMETMQAFHPTGQGCASAHALCSPSPARTPRPDRRERPFRPLSPGDNQRTTDEKLPIFTYNYL